MANSRIPRFVLEVFPPQFVTVMRHRTRKMLDTISEEDRDDSLSPTSKSSQTSVSLGSMAAAASSSSSSSSSVTSNSQLFLKGVSSFSVFK
ncbi:hypothetical protein PTKIN_Ptkin01aG0083900 [Pterospermum kingtungense]